MTGCIALEGGLTDIKSSVAGLPMIAQTYDVQSNIIDRIKGASIDISPESEFSIVASDGTTVEKSAVINITIVGKQMMHVGSALIAYDSALPNVFDEYAKTVDIKNLDRSVPFMNKMVNSFENAFTGQSMLILVRSQNGTPISNIHG